MPFQQYYATQIQKNSLGYWLANPVSFFGFGFYQITKIAFRKLNKNKKLNIVQIKI